MYQASQSYCSSCACGSSGYFSGLEQRLEVHSSSVSEMYASKIALPSYSSQSFPIISYSATGGHLSPSFFFPYAASASRTPSSYQGTTAAYQLFAAQPEYHFDPDQFLKPGRGGKFVGAAEEVREFVEEAFEKMCNSPFPEDIKVSVLEASRFRKLAPHPGTVGLSLNRRKLGLLSEIFVVEGSLGRVLLTIGHEIGHVLTETLDDKRDEEAKAYAFSLLWMQTIQEHNIAGLGNAFIAEQPAENGLHNVAFGFVQRLMQRGRLAKEIYLELVQRQISVAAGSTFTSFQ